MIKEFYEWLTYNPNNVPVAEITVPIITGCIILMIMFFLLFFVVTGKVSLKICIASVLSAPYFMLDILWVLCFTGDSVFVCLTPTYPLFGLILIMLVRRYLKANRAGKTSSKKPEGVL